MALNLEKSIQTLAQKSGYNWSVCQHIYLALFDQFEVHKNSLIKSRLCKILQTSPTKKVCIDTTFSCDATHLTTTDLQNKPTPVAMNEKYCEAQSKGHQNRQ